MSCNNDARSKRLLIYLARSRHARRALPVHLRYFLLLQTNFFNQCTTYLIDRLGGKVERTYLTPNLFRFPGEEGRKEGREGIR